MKKIQTLENKYKLTQSVKQQSFEFVKAVYDYIEYTLKDRTFRKIINKYIIEKIRQHNKQIKKLEDKTIKNALGTHEKLLNLLNSNNIEENIANEYIKKFNDYLKGKVTSSNGKAAELHFTQCELIRKIFNNYSDLHHLLNEYIEIEQFNNHKTIRRYKFNKYYDELENLKEKLKKEYDIEIWGSFDKLFKIYKAVQRYINNDKSLYKTDDTEYIATRVLDVHMVEEIKKLYIDRNLDPHSLLNQNDYKNDVTRLHNFLQEKYSNYKVIEKIFMPIICFLIKFIWEIIIGGIIVGIIVVLLSWYLTTKYSHSIYYLLEKIF